MANILVWMQGIAFFHAGSDILRSKSLDRDSYNSGDSSRPPIGLPIQLVLTHPPSGESELDGGVPKQITLDNQLHVLSDAQPVAEAAPLSA